MALTPINQEQVQQTAQVLLSFLSDERVSIPAPILEGVVSGKSLLRALLAGELVICANKSEPKPAIPLEAPPEADAPSEEAVAE